MIEEAPSPVLQDASTGSKSQDVEDIVEETADQRVLVRHHETVYNELLDASWLTLQ